MPNGCENLKDYGIIEVVDDQSLALDCTKDRFLNTRTNANLRRTLGVLRELFIERYPGLNDLRLDLDFNEAARTQVYHIDVHKTNKRGLLRMGLVDPDITKLTNIASALNMDPYAHVSASFSPNGFAINPETELVEPVAMMKVGNWGVMYMDQALLNFQFPELRSDYQ